MVVDVGSRDVVRIRTNGSCFTGSVSSDTLVIGTTASTGLVCKPLDLDITVSAAGPSRCIVSSISKLSPAELAALPKKMRP